ncbi:hypothetical protein HMPREF0494_1718 [Limosilactobacillus antri DSM 16041]|uniref:Uncharacterized protein n=2 Tax=Limosilactobacillus antri TaxID=227943 RepID=C8P8S4_9LACO|nr:hypothetical protein HMPREF0494_1718 [Limosilactobacillus antri DSM 16041]KRK60487.1 hypothetical protein FC31_GL001561 [Limosilactobacillus antri DSM 16041]
MEMKKRLRTAGIIILAVVLMLLVGINSWRTVAPTTVLIAPLAGLVAASVAVGLGTVSGVATALIGGLALLLLGSADWLLVLNYLLLVLLIGWVIGWRLPLTRRLTHQQLIWLGIVAGITEFGLNLVQVAVMGAVTGAGWLIFVRLAWLPGVLTALLFAVLVGPLAAGWRWLGRQLLPPEPPSGDSADSPRGPVEIDLSHKDKRKQK